MKVAVAGAGKVGKSIARELVDMVKTIEFWEAAGFEVNRYDDGFAFVSFDEQSD